MSKAKLLGIEFGRGLSTYAVVLVHSGDKTWGIPVSSAAIEFRLFFYFAVPFFLATAFYFMTAKPEIGYSSKFWRSRVERILIPYFVWSILFLIARVIVFTLTNKPERVQQLLQDPLSIVFMGGASYHLYFLPLLFAGTVLALLIPLLERLKIHGCRPVFLLVLSIALYYLLETSGNSFQLGKNIAFESLLTSWQVDSEQPILRLLLVEIAWLVRCLPYFLISLILNHHSQYLKGLLARIKPIGWIVLFLVCNTLGRMFLPGTLSELLVAYTLLLSCISLSVFFRGSFVENLVSSVGVCSFGIYLIHPFVMNITKPLTNKMLSEITDSVSIYSILALSIPTFLLSWLVVSYFVKTKQVAKYLFGI
jgi:peptidoglycan/LPS O-acetylase OafA/YrhL